MCRFVTCSICVSRYTQIGHLQLRRGTQSPQTNYRLLSRRISRCARMSCILAAILLIRFRRMNPNRLDDVIGGVHDVDRIVIDIETGAGLWNCFKILRNQAIDGLWSLDG